MVKRITIDQLVDGLHNAANDLENPTDPLLDFRTFKQQNLQQYWSAVIQIQFKPASIGTFSRGRGRKIRQGDRYGQATGLTRRGVTRSFSISSTKKQAELALNTDQPFWAKYFDITLRKRRIPQFRQGILPWFPIRDSNKLTEEGAKFVTETMDKNL